MGKMTGRTEDKSKSSKNKYFIYLGIAAIVLLLVFSIKTNFSDVLSKNNGNITGSSAANSSKTNIDVSDAAQDLKIPVGEITEVAKFYPYRIDGINMEVMAVKASDGTIRTAFNTCQVCFDSGKGYYKQEGNKVVCQNCGNVFSIDDIEKVRNGCNPVPISEAYKSQDNGFITISKNFLEKNKTYFENWKK